MDNKITELPWYESSHGFVKSGDKLVASVYPCGDVIDGQIIWEKGEQEQLKANAAYIVMAANMHDELVTTGKKLIEQLEQGADAVTYPVVSDFKNAISKATSGGDK